MIKFFRKIRYDLMRTGKTGKYFKYAIGEIILVVLGILIAIQINNWNTSRNEITKLNSILNIVKVDLVKDTLNISYPINLYEKKNTQILNILENRLSNSSLDTITELNYKNHISISRLLTYYRLFQMQNKGIKLLKSVTSNLDFENDTLITSLIDSHSKFELYFDGNNESMAKLSFQTIEDFEKHSWFTDWLLNKYNKDMFYYLYDDEYKRKAGSYSIYSEQFLSDLKLYDSFAKTYIAVIDKRLNEY